MLGHDGRCRNGCAHIVSLLYSLMTEFYAEEEVKIILDRVISDGKERERSKQEEKEREERSKQEEREEREREKRRANGSRGQKHELELRKLELSQQNQPLNDESEKLDEYESIRVSEEKSPKKNSYKFQGGVNYSGARPKETPKDFKSKFQIKKEPVHEKNHEKDFEKRRQLRCYVNAGLIHISDQPQCDKLKKNYTKQSANETVRNGTDVLATYTSLGTVNGIEMPILRDTGATLDLICKNT
ncbi:SCAN box domain-containing protein [Trichonephila clavipes]|uniref:SCAN box domain-containing protein n=1 Tax=Trichonephila clavipes TaxID=2585209 RepID=A0A8X6W1V2_TRICX|nr:SCAN box domain-containing protein [Trichonephila clavipes]